MKKLSDARILIVEDEPLLLQLVRGIFAKEGLNVDSAGNGQEALKKIAFTQYDLVLTDIMMPQMTGVELCHRVKSDPNFPQPSAWFALTAYTPEDAQGHHNLAKFDESFFKPLNPNLLAKMIIKRLTDSGYSF